MRKIVEKVRNIQLPVGVLSPNETVEMFGEDGTGIFLKGPNNDAELIPIDKMVVIGLRPHPADNGFQQVDVFLDVKSDKPVMISLFRVSS